MTATTDRAQRTLIIRFARVRTPEFTYVKFGVQATVDGNVYVTDPRNGETVATLSDTNVERLPGAEWRAAGWVIEDMGCGCRDRVHIEPSPPA